MCARVSRRRGGVNFFASARAVRIPGCRSRCPAGCSSDPGASNPSVRVRDALAEPLVGHLDPSFLALADEVQERLRRALETELA